MARDPVDVGSPGVQLKWYQDIAAVPRPGDRVMIDGRKFDVENVLWNFPHEGVIITVTVSYVNED